MHAGLADTSLHEIVHLIDEPAAGLFGAIAVHSTALGPAAAGGCRIWDYPRRSDLVDDALRLSKGMTYKNAMAGLPFGGGKAVLMLAPNANRRTALRAFGCAVEALRGRYITAEDVGSSVADMQIVAEATRYVSGLPVRVDAAGGDPSPWTALGVFLSIELAVQRKLRRDLRGVRVAVQGLGNVGGILCRMLADAGARLVVADPEVRRVRLMVERHDAQPCPVEAIHRADVDVFAPCALGGALSVHSVSELHAGIVCGAANNQLAEVGLGGVLRDRGVLYAPDYVVNAGGIVNVAAEWLGEPGHSVEERVRLIPARLTEVFDRADRLNVATNIAADQLVDQLLAGAREKTA